MNKSTEVKTIVGRDSRLWENSLLHTSENRIKQVVFPKPAVLSSIVSTSQRCWLFDLVYYVGIGKMRRHEDDLGMIALLGYSMVNILYKGKYS